VRARTSEIDWNEAWQAAREPTRCRAGKETWDRRAPAFARSAARSGYVEQLLEIMSPDPTWTVLDVGSGAGTLAVPLARLGCCVTALDFSTRMLDLLGRRCAEEGLANVSPVPGSWEDDWERLGIGTHDVALASRSLSVHDLRGALVKLDRAARRRVFVTAPAGDRPIERSVAEAVGRPYVAGPDYLYAYNLLHQLGIFATVEFITVRDTRSFPTPDAALDELLWMLLDPSPDEVRRLRAWLEGELAPTPDGVQLTSRRKLRWAVLSWARDGER
jgi:SAM-dependent methyltransferase